MREQKKNKILKWWELFGAAVVTLFFRFSLVFSIVRLLGLGWFSIPGSWSLYVLIGMMLLSLIAAVIWTVFETHALATEGRRMRDLYQVKDGHVGVPKKNPWVAPAIERLHEGDLKHRDDFESFAKLIFTWAMSPFLTMSSAMGVVELWRQIMGHPPLTRTHLMLTVGLSFVFGLVVSGISWYLEHRKRQARLPILQTIQKASQRFVKKWRMLFAPRKKKKLHWAATLGITLLRVVLPLGVYFGLQSLIPFSSVTSAPHWASLVSALLVLGVTEAIVYGKGFEAYSVVRFLSFLIGMSVACFLAVRLFVSTFSAVSVLTLGQHPGMMGMICFFSVVFGLVAATLDYVEEQSLETLLVSDFVRIQKISVKGLQRHCQRMVIAPTTREAEEAEVGVGP